MRTSVGCKHFDSEFSDFAADARNIHPAVIERSIRSNVSI